MIDEHCPGEGRCHGSLSWCDHCGDVARVCDAIRCDRHRCVECGEIRLPEKREHWAYVCDLCDPPDPVVKLLGYRIAVSCFVANIATAAQLERSFWLGAQYGRSQMGPARLAGELMEQFRPGCGRSAT